MLTCQGSLCVVGSCGAGTKKCGARCVDLNDVAYGCGTSTCDASICPNPGTGGSVVCQAGACVIATCSAGTKKCGARCVAIGDPMRRQGVRPGDEQLRSGHYLRRHLSAARALSRRRGLWSNHGHVLEPKRRRPHLLQRRSWAMSVGCLRHAPFHGVRRWYHSLCDERGRKHRRRCLSECHGVSLDTRYRDAPFADADVRDFPNLRCSGNQLGRGVFGRKLHR